MKHDRNNTNKKSILALAGVLTACLAGSAGAQPQTIFAGDVDNFGDTNGPDDTLIIRGQFGNWLGRSGSGGNNTAYHNGEPMPFDADLSSEGAPHGSFDWEFGYTFDNLPTLHAGAMLSIRLKCNLFSGNDGINLQYTGDGSNRSFLWGAGLDVLNGGYWGFGEYAVFDIPLDNLPVTGGNIIGDINAVRYLDVYVQDDTAVDWIELTVPAPGTASLLALGALVAMRRRRR